MPDSNATCLLKETKLILGDEDKVTYMHPFEVLDRSLRYCMHRLATPFAVWLLYLAETLNRY